MNSVGQRWERAGSNFSFVIAPRIAKRKALTVTESPDWSTSKPAIPVHPGNRLPKPPEKDRDRIADGSSSRDPELPGYGLTEIIRCRKVRSEWTHTLWTSGVSVGRRSQLGHLPPVTPVVLPI